MVCIFCRLKFAGCCGIVANLLHLLLLKFIVFFNSQFSRGKGMS